MITLQFAGSKTIAGGLIRHFEHGCLYDHVDAVLPAGSLLGARIKGGVLQRPKDYLGPKVQVHRMQLESTPAQETAFYEFLYRQVGKPYDWSAVVAFAFNRDWRAHDSWYCSELIAAAIEYAQWLRVSHFPSPVNRIDPGDLFMMLGVDPRVSCIAPV